MDWESTVRENAPAMFRLAMRILRRTTDAEDAVQEAFLRAYESGRRKQIRNWRAFLSRLTVNAAIDRLRLRKMTLPLGDDALSVHQSNSPLTETSLRELADRLQHEVAKLPRQQAKVFCLCHFDGKSNKEIAVILDLRVGAVATILHKARKRLAAALEVFQETSDAKPQ